MNKLLTTVILLAVLILLCTKIDKETALSQAAKNDLNAKLYSEMAEKKHLDAMEYKAEAEQYRKDYYKKVFVYGYDQE